MSNDLQVMLMGLCGDNLRRIVIMGMVLNTCSCTLENRISIVWWGTWAPCNSNASGSETSGLLMRTLCSNTKVCPEPPRTASWNFLTVSQAPPQTYEIRICILTWPPVDSYNINFWEALLRCQAKQSFLRKGFSSTFARVLQNSQVGERNKR